MILENFNLKLKKKFYKEYEARLHLQKSLNSVFSQFKNLSCHTLDKLTDINYIKDIKAC